MGAGRGQLQTIDVLTHVARLAKFAPMLKSFLVVAVLSLSLFACKKKEGEKAEAPKTTEPSMTASGAAPTDKPADPAMKPADTTTPPVAAAGEIKSVDDYTKMGMEMMDQLAGIFTAAGKDCDKLAADLSKWVDANKSKKEAADAFEKANPDAKKALDEKAKPQMEKFIAAMGPAMESCKDHQGLKDAMAKMGD